MRQPSALVRRLLRGAGQAVAGLVLVAVLVVLVVAVLVPRLGGATTYTVLTGSMRPSLPPGTLVVVRPTSREDVAVGSVVTYQLRSGDPTVVTHRVVSTTVDEAGHRRYRLQGDANDSPDPGWVRPEQLRGTVWYAVPRLGRAAQWLSPATRDGLRLAAVTALLCYALVMFARAGRDGLARRRRGVRRLAGVRHG